MIEVEKKVEITPEIVNHFERRGSFCGEIVIQDIYFDTEDYCYTSQNMWLRNRDKAWELKRAVKGGSESIDRYEEITDEDEIVKSLGLESGHIFLTVLKDALIYPFAEFTTCRRKYILGPLNVDVDVADFGEFTYQIAEIERLVMHEQEIPNAEKEINNLLIELKVDVNKKPMAKLSAFLKACRPHHYNALVKAGVIS